MNYQCLFTFGIYNTSLGSLFTHFKSVYALIQSLDRRKNGKYLFGISVHGKIALEFYEIKSKRNIV